MRQAGNRLVVIALSSVGVALLVVGFVSGTLMRHIVQIVPVLGTLGVVLRENRWGLSAAVAIFSFWFWIMAMIWLFLFGVSDLAQGTYTNVEIALTIVIAVSCLCGIITSLRETRGSWAIRAASFMTALGFQVFFMWVSLQPALANR